MHLGLVPSYWERTLVEMHLLVRRHGSLQRQHVSWHIMLRWHHPYHLPGPLHLQTCFYSPMLPHHFWRPRAPAPTNTAACKSVSGGRLRASPLHDKDRLENNKARFLTLTQNKGTLRTRLAVISDRYSMALLASAEPSSPTTPSRALGFSAL